EMVAEASHSTLAIGGASYDAIKLVVSAAAPLTAHRTVSLGTNFPIPAGTTYPGEAQAVIRVKHPVGITSVSVMVQGWIGAALTSFTIGHALTNDVDANLWPASMDEVLSYCVPGVLPFDAGTDGRFNIAIHGRAGQTPSAEIWISQVG